MKRKCFNSARLLALVLSLALIVALAGCGAKKPDPKQAVTDAFNATQDTLSEAQAAPGSDEIREIVASGKYHQDMELYLTGANVGLDLSGFYGTGLSMSGDVDMDARKLDVDMGLRIADYDALSLGFGADDNIMYISCPGLLGDGLYGVDTETLSALPGSGGDESMNFNVFDQLASTVVTDADGNPVLLPDTAEAIDSGWDAMGEKLTWAAVEEKKTVSGVECDIYTLTIPADAAADYVCGIVDALSGEAYIETVLMPVVISEGYASYEDFVAQGFGAIKDGIKEGLVDDIGVEFALFNGEIRGIETSVTMHGEAMDIDLLFGNGKDVGVADYSEMNIALGDVRLTLVSEGEHSSDEEYTDLTKITVADSGSGGELQIEAETVLSFDTGEYKCDIFFDFGGADGVQEFSASMSLAGTLSYEDGVKMSFDKLGIDVMGMSLDFEGSYSVSESAGVGRDFSGGRLVAEMSESEINELGGVVETNALGLVMAAMEEVPALAELVMMFM